MARPPQDPFAEGLTLEETLPLTWEPLALPLEESERLRISRDDEATLRLVALLDDFRPDAAEEPGAAASELAHIDFKLNVLLMLVSRLLAEGRQFPPAVPVRISARGLEWVSATPVPATGGLLVSLYLQPPYPRPLTLPARPVAIEPTAGGQRVRVMFEGLTESAEDALERLIFRNHRRRIAQSRVPRNAD